MALIVFILTALVPYAIDLYPVPFLLWTVGPVLWSLLAVYLSKIFYDQATASQEDTKRSLTPIKDVAKLSFFAIAVVVSTIAHLPMIVAFVLLFDPAYPAFVNTLLLMISCYSTRSPLVCY
jgi:hypothetical protein